MLSRSVCTLVVLVVPAALSAQRAPTQSELDSVSARGRALAGYQRAALRASTQLVAKNPDPSRDQRYVAYRADSGWVVAFGRLNAGRDTFFVSNIGIPAPVNGTRVDSLFEFVTFNEPGPDVDYLVRAARAMDNAVMALGATERSYSAAALPSPDGDWFVYLTPAADIANVWPLGDDVRYRVSADGERILEKRRMHSGMVEEAPSARGDGARLAVGRYRTALRDEPEDSDVFHVLARRPQTPQLVVTKHFQYVIGVDGSIRLVTGRETVVGATR
ncbi:MAG TPA: hypothetical protein VJN70_19005 [Gemmatimonadaceae bacterium]|nr:hypothetical protein [Gemmatimonadaceae bacterium]